MTIRTRDATADDREFAIATARRLADFGPPIWRSPLDIVTGEVRTLDDFFDGSTTGSSLMIAEEESGIRLGFVYVETLIDYFSSEPHGHVGMIAVASAAEGRGVGRVLMEAAEAWARSHGFSRLTLNVFAGNARARAFYETLDFAVETLRYVKNL
jgi:ribosomal protein S18 acetylase RimI-like enzyme